MQAEIQDPYKLELRDHELQERVDQDLCRVVEETVRANADRDSQLRSYRWQLEGFSQPNPNQPWPGASQVESTISRELHTTLLAALWNGARQTPYACYESVDPNGVEKASKTETYLNLKAQQYQFDDVLYQAIYLALEGRFSVIRQYSDQAVQRYFDLQPEETAVDEDGTETVVTEERVELKTEPKDFCVKFRTPDPWDFYVYPETARGPQFEDGCLLTIEKMYLTQEDLSLGVLYQGYDREKVQQMIDKGPASMQDESEGERNDEMERDGISTMPGNSREGGLWQCFEVVGRMPLCLDEDNDPSIPEKLLHVDCLWMVCPALQIVFKQAYSPDPEGVRLYTVFNVIDKPNRLLGEGIVSIIAPLHEEMTAMERFGINNMNLEASPVMTVAESWLTRYAKWTVAPGRFMPRQSGDPVGPKPLVWDTHSQELIPAWHDRLESQAQRLAASQNANSGLAGKVRKAAEVHFAEGMQQTKFDLFLSNIQRGVVGVFEKLRLQLAQHMEQSQSDFEEAYFGGTSVEIDRDTLSGNYRVFAQAASDSLTPAARLAKQQAVAEIVNAYWLSYQQWVMLGCQGYMWHLTHRLLMLAGERTPEKYIGPEPEQPQMQGGTPPGVPPLGIPMGMEGENGVQAAPAGLPGEMAGLLSGQTGHAPPMPQFGAEGMAGAGMAQASSMSPRNGAN